MRAMHGVADGYSMRRVVLRAAAYVVIVISILQVGFKCDGAGGREIDWRARSERPCRSASANLAVVALVVAGRGNVLKLDIVPGIGIEIAAKVRFTRGWG